jgi:outer membrane receptor protein involved in Fe transport
VETLSSKIKDSDMPIDLPLIKHRTPYLTTFLYTTVLTIFLGVNLAKAAEIEEIVVTARAIEESVRDIPVAITAISEERMNLYGIESFEDLEALAPAAATEQVFL